MTAVATGLATAATRAKVSESVARPLAVGFRSLETEILEPRELEVRGEMPKDLSGVLYRIGPARHDVYGDRFRSWFDGDGMVHALTVEGGRVTYRNRFVATAGRVAEESAKKRLYGGFATRGPGSAMDRFLRRGARKNPANTNIVFHAGKLLALCEAGRPHRLDPETLATIGEDDMSGTLPPSTAYSAHPKLDPDTGEMWNFGVSYGKDAVIHVYRTTKDGHTNVAAKVTLPAAAMVHDYALTKTRAVFVIAPIVLPRVPLGLLFGQRSYAESLRYRPELGVSIAVVDRASGETRWWKTDPFMMFHTVNAWDDGDDLVIDVCAYPDASIMRTIEDVMAGDTPQPARAYLERLRLASAGYVTRARLSDVAIEFPRVAGRARMKEHRKVYGVAWADDREFISQPAVLDTVTGKAELAPMSAAEFAGECVPVSKAGATSESDVWLVSLVLDGASRTTELRVFDGADVAAPPVATARLPHVVPLGFHGNWTSRPTG